ncbi:phage tail protein [Sphingosinicella sp. CPCC 101087]|uniref:phage tail protein n=1 Tax=Sphingosinicella sp. CPCC 101087 TaxID=2497754 RepID=UPI00101D2856|nr:phage tail protein [Sphingosinicella sp. CPCC 101087]
MPLMSLGMFIFALDSVPYEQLARRQSWRHGKTERVGAFPASQFLGPAEDMISLSGLLVPPIAGDFGSMRVLEELASQGEAHPLVDSEGVVWGHYDIESIDRKQSVLMDNGVPRKTDFTIELRRVR